MITVLKAKNINKTFYHPIKVDILKNISLTAQQGESIAIVGASGEGKSTLLHILGTLEKSDGYIEIMQKDISKSNQSKLRNENIGFIFQGFHLLEDYTIIDNVLMPARISRKNVSKGSTAYKKGEELLELVGLSHRSQFHAKLLSGGERQRVAIARALCNDPEIILADEPSGNLDHHTSQEIYQLLLNCTKKQNKTLIVVTHDNEFANLCDTRYSLQDGHLTQMI